MKNHTETNGKLGSNQRDQIARKAYEIWQAEGCPHGRAAEHWGEAEELLNPELAKQPIAQPNPPAAHLALDSKAVLPASTKEKSYAQASQ